MGRFRFVFVFMDFNGVLMASHKFFTFPFGF